MVFNSMEFLIFLPIVFFIYWGTAPRYRWIILMASGYYFYMSWNAKYVFLILATTAVSYAAVLMIEKSGSKKQKKKWLHSRIPAKLCILISSNDLISCCRTGEAMKRKFREDDETCKLILEIILGLEIPHVKCMQSTVLRRDKYLTNLIQAVHSGIARQASDHI